MLHTDHYIQNNFKKKGNLESFFQRQRVTAKTSKLQYIILS